MPGEPGRDLGRELGLHPALAGHHDADVAPGPRRGGEGEHDGDREGAGGERCAAHLSTSVEG